MGNIRTLLALSVALCAPLAPAQPAQPTRPLTPIDPGAWRMVELVNAARSQQGAQPLAWDASLAQAALAHCQRMIAEGQIAHRYGSEPSVGARAAQAGAHFSLIEENIAIGPS